MTAPSHAPESSWPVQPLDPTAPQRQVAFNPTAPLARPFVPDTAALRAGRTTPRDFLEARIETLQRDEPAISAFVTLGLDGARQAADASTARWRSGAPLSPMDGMPVVVKDMIETIDLPTQMNSPIYRNWQSRRDAAPVLALRRAGAVILGKTVTTEFACGNSGPTRNPYDTRRTPGGSSSGSAAAVGGGMASFGLGTQTHGSTIRPAGYCGAYALKPTHGALPVGGLAPLAPTLDHVGVIGASLEDVWAGAKVIASLTGGTPPHPGLAGPAEAPAAQRPRVLVRLDTLGWQETPATSQAAFEAAVEALARSGARILDARNDQAIAAFEEALRGINDFANDLLAWEAQWPLRAYRAHGAGMVGARIHDLLARADGLDAAAYARAVAQRQLLRAQFADLATRTDGFVLLASSGPAIEDHGFTGSRSYALPWTLLGAPAFALPLLVAEDMPLGLQVAGFAEKDAETCAMAAWVRDTLLPRNA